MLEPHIDRFWLLLLLLLTPLPPFVQVERFVQARHCAKSNPEEMVKTCHELLDTVGETGTGQAATWPA